MKHELERVEIPGEVKAYGRAWAVVAREFEDRVPSPQRSHWPRVAAVAVALAALVAAAVSPPGQAVIDEIREVVGVERAERALFSLPSEGRLLVTSDAGVWVVQQDGSKRLFEGYGEASWSPFGRYIVATRKDELAALEPDGDTRWTLPRRGEITSPRWTGSETDTRIAYVDRTGARVVAGDGTGDRLLAAASPTISWRPGSEFVLAYVSPRGRVAALDAGTERSLWAKPRLSGRFPDAKKLVWSSDGKRLLLVRPSMLVVFGTESAAPLAVRQMRGVVDAAFKPGTHRVTVVRRDDVVELDAERLGEPPRRLFAGAGPFEGLAWSPDGRWLLVSWPAADQWIFVRADRRRIRAVSNISEQFRSRTFPRVDGWCCAR